MTIGFMAPAAASAAAAAVAAALKDQWQGPLAFAARVGTRSPVVAL